MFAGCSKLKTIPEFNTSKGKSYSSFCNGCSSLENLPVLNMTNVSNIGSITNMVTKCSKLTTESLNNILTSLLMIPSTATGTKTLRYIGLSSTQATTCTTLSKWAELEVAGWTTGY